MKYAKEVIELMSAYPGREFKIAHIVKYISPEEKLSIKKREAIRQGALRVLNLLADSGVIQKEIRSVKSVRYIWVNKN